MAPHDVADSAIHIFAHVRSAVDQMIQPVHHHLHLTANVNREDSCKIASRQRYGITQQATHRLKGKNDLVHRAVACIGVFRYREHQWYEGDVSIFCRYFAP